MNKTPRMQYGIAEVTQEMRHEIQQLLLLGYQGKEIQEAYKVTLSVITQERKRLQLGKWSPDSPSEKARKRRVYQIPTATPTATRRPSNPSSGVVEIPIEFVLEKPRLLILYGIESGNCNLTRPLSFLAHGSTTVIIVGQLETYAR